jgi:GNAT superfamily N-acetyltransferase
MFDRQVFRVDEAEVTLRREPWDCAQLGLESAKLEALRAPSDESAAKVVRAAVDAAREAGFVHLASRLAATDRRGERALQAAGFQHVDTVVNLALTPATFRPPAATIDARWATAADAEAIGQLSADAFSDPQATFNRYLNDPRLTVAQVRQVYFVWGSTSVGGAAADATLTTWDGATLVGFLTLKHANAEGVARVPLNAVADSHRGKGLYRALVAQTATHVFAQGAKRLEVTTQLQQLAVQRTWLQLGGSLEGANYSFHLWP